MADIALTTAGRIEVVHGVNCVQHTLPAAAAITAGAPVYINTDGKFANSDMNGGAALQRIWGIATRTVAAGESVTAIRRGWVDGFAVSGLDHQAKLYGSDTVGRIADAASGTTSIVVGHVIPGWAQSLGTAADKIVAIEIND